MREVEPVVVQDDELDMGVGAVGQRWAQVLSDEVPLLLGREAQALEGVVVDQPGRGLVLCCHRPECHIVLGVFIQEPGVGGRGEPWGVPSVTTEGPSGIIPVPLPQLLLTV